MKISLFLAIIAVESGGNNMAIGDAGRSVGPAQIQAVVIEDVNRITGRRYTLRDRYCRQKSAEIFWAYTDHYGRRYGYPVSDEVRARVWNGGPQGPSKRSTERYWAKVRANLAKR